MKQFFQISQNRKAITAWLLSIIMLLTVCGGMNISKVTTEAAEPPSITYRVHQQGYGWLPEVGDGKTAGKTGEKKRLEALEINLHNVAAGHVAYHAHVQGIGWQEWGRDGKMAGTVGQSKRIEAVQINLLGPVADEYDVFYRVHVQGIGWMNWCKNGQTAGTVGQSKRVESIEIKLVPKIEEETTLTYTVHQQSYGWSNDVKMGQTAGVTGQSKRLEALKISLKSNVSGGVSLQGHVQSYGWMNTVGNEQVCGTTGQSKRLEAIKLNLTGNISAYYDIYYRVHCQTFGWLDWAKNGAAAGSKGYGKRMEAVQIRLVPKGGKAPGSTANPYKEYEPPKIDPKRYEVKVNKQMNTVTIYNSGVPIKAMVCSTGADTPLGTFPLGAKYRWALMIHDVWAQYACRVYKGILFHSVWYYKKDNRTLSAREYNKLGQQASAGCIRLTCGDAKWLYDNVPSGTPVTIYNSPDPGPLGKPTAPKIPANQGWDPTDPAFAK